MKTFIILFISFAVVASAHADDVRDIFGHQNSVTIGSETIPAPQMLKLYALNANQKFAIDPSKGEAGVSLRMHAITELIQLVGQQGLPGKFLWTDENNQTVNELWNAGRYSELDVFISYKILKISEYFVNGLGLPEDISSEIKLKNKSLSSETLTKIAQFLRAQNSPEEFVASISPANQTYKNLVSLYNELLQKTEITDSAPINVVLKLGVKNPPAIHALKERLAFYGFANQGSDDVVDSVLQQSIKDFQSAHGLTADGIIGSITWSYLTKSLASLKTQVLLNIDRLRWLPASLGSEHVWVNLASQNLTYIVNDQPVMKFRVINGRPDRKTPVLQDSISYAEMNPTWTVPYSILVKDKLSVLRENPNKIYEWNMKVIDDVSGHEMSPDSINWNNVSPSNLHYTLIQRPGPKNALGLVKFPMTNAYSIYLHDTNARELFAEDYRQLSSGCVRLQQPFEFAEATIRDPNQWSLAQIQTFTSYATEVPTKVSFNRRIPVYLVYTTIEKDDSNRIISRGDTYGIDRDHFAAIRKYIE